MAKKDKDKKSDAEGGEKKGSKKKLILLPVVLLLVAGVGYKMVLAPKPKPVKKHIEGSLVSLGTEFVVNLAGGHYGRVSVSLLLDQAPAKAAEGSTAPALEQNDAVRAIITDDLTGLSAGDLTGRGQRHELLARLLKDLKKKTDEPVKEVLFTDLAVQ
jgi:flagellar basal body-associated protein FliL